MDGPVATRIFWKIVICNSYLQNSQNLTKKRRIYCFPEVYFNLLDFPRSQLYMEAHNFLISHFPVLVDLIRNSSGGFPQFFT